MANPLAFSPKPVNPKLELQRRLDAAPVEHGEAMLVALDLLQKAHDEGLLDLIHGLVGAKDTIAGKLAEYAKLPEGVSGIRNLMGLAKLLMVVDPDVLLALTKAFDSASSLHSQEVKAPGLFTLTRRAVSEDSRRALSLMTLLLSEVGRSLNTGEHNQGRVSSVEPLNAG
jgi:uncharacterized protein YjgD (DUF1641 family)